MTQHNADMPICPQLSIVIPALNEADYLGQTLSAVKRRATHFLGLEIIVVDSGSCDATQSVARDHGARVIVSDTGGSGRGEPLNKGAMVSRGNVLLFLDADVTPPDGFDTLIYQALSSKTVLGGAFEFAFDGEEYGLRVVEFINKVRYKIRQRFYGDQGVFVRRDAFDRVGGIPLHDLMDIPHFCASLREIGHLELIPKPILTSPRRFRAGGIYRTLLKDIEIWACDMLGFSTGRYVRTYWKENVQRAS